MTPTHRMFNGYYVTANGLSIRGDLCGPPNPEQVEICKSYIERKMVFTANIGKCTPSSYGLKHEIENSVGTYVSNGACILAAIDLGVRVVPTGINAKLCLKPLNTR